MYSETPVLLYNAQGVLSVRQCTCSASDRKSIVEREEKDIQINNEKPHN